MRRLSLNGSYSSFRKVFEVAAFKSAVIALPAAFCTITLLAQTPASLAANSAEVAAKANSPSNTQSKANKRKKGLIANAQPEGDASSGQSQPKNADKNDNKKESAEKDKDGKDAKESNDTQVKNDQYARQYFEEERQSRKRKYAHASSTVQIYAPQAVVWRVLIDFERYPEIFKRIDSCHITKKEHGLLFAETFLKPQMFVKKLCQHTVTDISQGPGYLQWKMLDGNFTSVLGSWTLSTTQDKKGKAVCEAKYTLEADPGPVIPGPMVSFLLHQVEHEVVTSFKKSCEKTFQNEGEKQQQADDKK